MKVVSWLRAGLALCLPFLGAAAQESKNPLPNRIHFNRDIRPILSENCLKCHGPDAKHREANLRLDLKEGAFKEIEKGHFAVVPGNLDRSEMWKRITSKDREEVMPPPKSGKKLQPREIELLKKWIEQGADWQGHWSLTPLQAPPLLKVRDAAWPKEALDAYVLGRLEEEGLKPSPEADRATLARRITLDLTGLPPTPAEVDAFVNDRSPDAYAKLVDRLLASPRYGEHMARFWLDLARYGDTHGLHLDNYREMWPYRDWVIRAFNENLSFDQFVTWQLAGDLLPEATIDQQVATGFNRCHVTTNEGGSIEEEVYCRNVFDRVETFGQVFFALTFTCTRCHDHKYDPLTQKDYYGLFAYFNSLDGQEMDGNRKDPTPVIKVPTPSEAAELARLRDGAGKLEARMNGPVPEIDPGQHDWEQATNAKLATQWSALEAAALRQILESQPKSGADKSVQAGEPKSRQQEITTKIPAGGIQALLLEVLPPDPEPPKETSLAFTISDVEAELVTGGKAEKIAFRVALAYGAAKDANAKNLIDSKPDTGWAGDARKRPAVALLPQKPIDAKAGTELRVRLLQQGAHAKQAVPRVRLSIGADAALFAGAAPATFGPWHVLGRIPAPEINKAFDTDFGPEQGVDLAKTVGELKWTKRDDLVNGKDQEYPSGVGVSYLFRTVSAPSHRKLTFTIHNDDAVLIWLNGSVVLSRNAKRGFRKYDANKVTVELEPGENRVLVKFVNYGTAGGTGSTRFNFDVVDEEAQDLLWDLADALSAPPGKRTDPQKALLQTRFRRERWSEWGVLSRQVARLRGEETELLAQMPITMVFKEKTTLRDCFILKRGEYDKRGDKITRATPASLPPPAKDLPVNRLGLAKWLLDPSHPLTARVAVNRLWQQFFGVGIVKTSEDFGMQGHPPSHFDLLDYLASQFIADGWDVKRFVKRLVMSATYRQSSKVTPDLVRRDPENRLYARGPRYRLDAEMLRDQALFLSGLLVEKVGGASVKPPQPEGLWEAVGYTGSNTYRFQRDPEPQKVFRRSMYIFWKRTSAPPMMTLFDAPSREACIARRERTNTPLQALMLMNEPQYVEAARHLAQKTIREGGATPEERVAWMVRHCTLRPASPRDVADLVAAYKAQKAIYVKDPEAAKKTVAYGDLPADASQDAPELAAWTLVANVLLNLDEVLNKR